MKLTIIAVGKLKESWWRDAAAEYVKRLGPYATVQIIEVADRDVTRDEVRAVADEAADILRVLPSGAHLVALDVGGRQLSSEALSVWMAAHGLDGRSHIAFVVGGAAGLGESVLQRAEERLSFGAMTLPHQLVRVVLLEQIYRAFRIMRGEPYHR